MLAPILGHYTKKNCAAFKCVHEGGSDRHGQKEREGQSVLPLSLSVSLQRAAIKTGLRSDMGLAVIMLPPTAWRKTKNNNKTIVTEPTHHHWADDAHQTETTPQWETCRNVTNLQAGKPAQLLQHGQKDLGLVGRERLHCLPKHCPHVAKSARRAKHNSYNNRSVLGHKGLKKEPISKQQQAKQARPQLSNY